MFATRKAIWLVASRAASCPSISRNAAVANQTIFRSYSSETPATEKDASPSRDTQSPASANGDQQSASKAASSSRSSKFTKPAYTSAAPSSKSAPRPTAKTTAKLPSKPDFKNSEKIKVPLAAAVRSITNGTPVTFATDEAPSDHEPLSSAGVDWATSYHGISSRPVSEKQYEVLMAPIDVTDIEVKPDGIIYLPEIKYRRRLNEAFGPMGWGMIPRGEAVVGDNIVTREYALIVGGRFVAQAQGENQYFSADQLPSSVEGCKSNALMRCCKDLGIASELWDPSFIRKFRKNNMESHWVEHASTNKKRQMWFRKGCVEVAYPYKLSK